MTGPMLFQPACGYVKHRAAYTVFDWDPMADDWDHGEHDCGNYTPHVHGADNVHIWFGQWNCDFCSLYLRPMTEDELREDIAL